MADAQNDTQRGAQSASGATSGTQSTAAQTSTADAQPTTDAQSMSQHGSGGQDYRAVRASELIGTSVRNRSDQALGEIEDLIVDMNTADVRYAVLAFDPGVFSDDKLYAVPTTELQMAADGEDVVYELDRERLQRAALDRDSFDDLVSDGRGVLDNLDTAWGIQQPTSGALAHRASDLIGKDVDSLAGESLGEVEDLVIDMGRQKVHYAVLAFDTGWTSPEQNFAVPLDKLNLDLDGDALVLAVDDSKLQAMKSFTDDRYANLNDDVWVADIDRYFVAVFPETGESSDTQTSRNTGDNAAPARGEAADASRGEAAAAGSDQQPSS